MNNAKSLSQVFYIVKGRKPTIYEKFRIFNCLSVDNFYVVDSLNNFFNYSLNNKNRHSLVLDHPWEGPNCACLLRAKDRKSHYYYYVLK